LKALRTGASEVSFVGYLLDGEWLMSKHITQNYPQSEKKRGAPTDLREAVRLRYFHGMLLDVYHFELEQNYFNAKRMLSNRLITGPGVVCGLDVELSDDNRRVRVLPGLAIDRCGREIIVPRESEYVELPPLPPYDSYETGGGGGLDYGKQRQDRAKHMERPEHRHYCDDEYAHIVLCYHECPGDPTPVMAGDCETTTMCASGSVREKYELKVREGNAPERRVDFPDVIEGRRISYAAIVDYVTRGCRAMPEDCCLPLANVLLRDVGDGWEPEIDLTCRPIVYTNRLLYHLLVSLVKKEETEY
jgi:hypothetical protein